MELGIQGILSVVKEIRDNLTGIGGGPATSVEVTNTSLDVNVINGAAISVEDAAVLAAVEALDPNVPFFNYTTGTISSSGDNSLLTLQESLTTYISLLMIQNESSTDTTVLIKSGATTIGRVSCPAKGDGVVLSFPVGRELRIPANNLFRLNLSGANAIGYTIVSYTA